MKNTFGQNIGLTLFGESHGAAIGAVLDGLCPGTPVDEENIRRIMMSYGHTAEEARTCDIRGCYEIAARGTGNETGKTRHPAGIHPGGNRNSAGIFSGNSSRSALCSPQSADSPENTVAAAEK